MLEHLPVGSTMLALLANSAGMAGPTPPPSPAVIVRNVEVVEGDFGKTAFEAEVVLSDGVPGTDPYVVDLSAISSSATAGDFDFPPVRLSFKSGGPPQVVKGVVAGDTIFEGDEAFWIHVEQAPGMYKPLIVHDGVVTISDDDAEKAPRLSLPPPSRVPESNGGWSSVLVPVTLSAPQAFPVTFDFATNGGRSGDYGAAGGTITLAPGETVANITVEIFGDEAWEPDTKFTLTVANVKGAIADPPTTEITITNDDPPTTLSADDGNMLYEGNEGITVATMMLKLSAPASGAGQVWLETRGSPALRGGAPDFRSIVPQVRAIEAGATYVIITLDVIGDTTPECNEGVTIYYGGLEMGDDTIHEARLVILNDDGSPTSDLQCPTDPFAGADAGRPVDAQPPVDGGAPPLPNDDIEIDVGNGLPKRRGCSCVAAGDSATSVIATLLLAAAALFATRRRLRGS